MNLDEMALEITRLKMRTSILQTLLLQTMLFAPAETSEESLRSNQRRTLQQLDEISLVLQLAYLNFPGVSGSDAERALHADELREIVEQMKSYISSIKR